MCLSALSLILFSSSLSRSLFFYNSSHTEPLLPYSSSSSHHPAPLISIPSLARFVSLSPIILFFYIILFRSFNVCSYLSLSSPLSSPNISPSALFFLYYFAATLFPRLALSACIPLSSLTHVYDTCTEEEVRRSSGRRGSDSVVWTLWLC